MAMSRLSDRVGQVLSDRYRLLAPIGTGASATVYLADDVTLRRRVAVKILHDGLADDEAFLRRFRAEAQAAAALNHPNILAVYDWGHDAVPFVVTEYLGGGSLRTMLDQGRRLSVAQALLIGLSASKGLDYAHRRGFVHRDIKPANLLFDEEGRLRIADFGLARALAEAAWTEPQGAVLGTARYASPEQARGETLDGRSDVYSLALVMIETVTGQVPFAGDTTLGTLMARVERPVPVPDSLGLLQPVIEAVGVPDRQQRPDAAAFTRSLLATAEHLDRPEPLVLAGVPVHTGDVAVDRDPTTIDRADIEPEIMNAPPGTVMDGIRIIPDGDEGPGSAAPVLASSPVAPSGGAASPSGAPAVPPADPLTRLVPDGEGLDEPERPSRRQRRRAAKRAQAAARVEAPVPAVPPAPPARRHRRWPWVTLCVMVVLALVAGGTGWWYESRTPSHRVPGLVGTDVATLARAIGGDGWVVQRTDVARAGTTAGQILSQSPKAGTTLAKGQPVELVVSTGPPPVPVPTNLAGLSLVEATSTLQADQLAVGAQTPTWSETYGTGTVLGVAPGTPTQLPPGTAVPLLVSKGPQPRIVPSIAAGSSVSAVTAQLDKMGLKVAQSTESSTTVDAGTVIRTSPAAGTPVAKGSTVTLVVSSGPPTTVIPTNVVGMSVAQAVAALQAAGLSVSGTQGNPVGTVVGTTPGVGTTVPTGSSVVLVTH